MEPVQPALGSCRHRYGWRPPLRIQFDDNGRILALDGNRSDPVVLANYQPGTWYGFEVRADEPVPAAVYYVDDLEVTVVKAAKVHSGNRP